MFKRIISLITFVAVLVSGFGLFPTAFADTGVSVTTIYDFAGRDFEAVAEGSTRKYPKLSDDENATATTAISFRNRGGNVNTDVIDSDTVMKYSGATSGDTYITFASDNNQTAYTSGRFVYTFKLYTNTDAVTGSMRFNNDSAVSLWESETLEENTWYDVTYVVDLGAANNNVYLSLAKEGSNQTVVSKTITRAVDSYTLTRFDIDVPDGETSLFTAYKDFKLTHTIGEVTVSAFTNGKEAGDTYEDGIFHAQTSGSGLFAIAKYNAARDLVALKVIESREELESAKLTMINENSAGYIIKVFRFDINGTPYTVSKELTYDNSGNIRVYAKEDFEGKVYRGTIPDGNALKLTDGRLEFTGDSTRAPRFSISAKQPGNSFIYEAEYQLGTATLDKAETVWEARLLVNNYTTKDGGNGVNTIIDLVNGTTVRNRKNGNNPIATLSTERPTKISLIFDTIYDTVDIYVDGVYADSGTKVFKVDALAEGALEDGIGFFIGHTSGDVSKTINMFVDNIHIYEGTEFKDISAFTPNVHNTDYSSDEGNTTIYERPSAEVLAKKALEAPHPRVMITPQKVNEIKTSTDINVTAWREALIQRADTLLDKVPYTYSISSTGSMQTFSEGIARVMDLGLAYQLTGDTKYSDRAYKEALVLMNYKRTYPTENGGEAQYDDWNSYSYLDVGEGSLFMAICYDWMYDAWTPAQKRAMTNAVMQKGIGLSYDILHGFNLESDEGRHEDYKTGTGWYDSANNWGSVCNGGLFAAAMAFMEEDPYKCATLAESTIRNVEYMMGTYAPNGAWGEGPSYWGYALKYLAAMLSTMEASCGTVYGIKDAEGFSETGLYSMALEGKAGVVNLGDSGTDHVKVPAMFYLSTLFKKPEYTAAALYAMDTFEGFIPNAFDLIYYDPDMNDAAYDVPTAYRYNGTEIVTFTSGLNHNDSFIAISGGKGKTSSHDHVDSGAVVVDMKGQRLFYDVGAEHYNATGYFGANRYKYFRSRPEGHNIFIINPDEDPNGYIGQNMDAVSEIVSYDAAGKKATMDLSAAYTRDASAASRKIELDGQKVIVTDSIDLIKDTSDVYWNWYVKTKVENEATDLYEAIGTIELIDGNKAAKITLNGIEYKVTFVTDCDYELAVENAAYYGGLTSPGSPTHSNEGYERLVVKMLGRTSGKLEIKTIIE